MAKSRNKINMPLPEDKEIKYSHMTDPFQEMVRRNAEEMGYLQLSHHRHRHSELCYFYARLRESRAERIVCGGERIPLSLYSLSVIAAAMGVSVRTASFLGHCADGGVPGPRYPRVAEEFLALGPEAFWCKYVHDSEEGARFPELDSALARAYLAHRGKRRRLSKDRDTKYFGRYQTDWAVDYLIARDGDRVRLSDEFGTTDADWVFDSAREALAYLRDMISSAAKKISDS